MSAPFRLPGGSFTYDREEYLDEWTDLGESVGRLFDAELLSFNPHLSFCCLPTGQTFSIPGAAALALRDRCGPTAKTEANLVAVAERVAYLEQTLRDVRAIAQMSAGNRRNMQVAGPARQIINRVNRVLPA